MAAAVSQADAHSRTWSRSRAKCRVVTRFRNTIGLPGRLSVRLQPNHPTDDPQGIAASTLDGLLLGCGDAVIGVNPATDSVPAPCDAAAPCSTRVRERFEIPTQTCVLTHVTTSLRAIERGAPVDLVFQSIGGTEAANRSFGVTLALLRRGARGGAVAAARHRRRQRDVLRDRPGQRAVGQRAPRRRPADLRGARLCAWRARYSAAAGQHAWSASSAPSTCTTASRSSAPAWRITSAASCSACRWACDVCYTNHAEADQDDMDTLLTLLGVAGVNLHHGRARRRRRDAELPEHLVPRRAVSCAACSA